MFCSPPYRHFLKVSSKSDSKMICVGYCLFTWLVFIYEFSGVFLAEGCNNKEEKKIEKYIPNLVQREGFRG